MDSSVWIDFFRPRPGPSGAELRRLIAASEPLAITGIIATEILQGLTRNVSEIEEYLGLWELLEPADFSTYLEAARISRIARSRGISLTTTDTLIAALAIEYACPVFTIDRDFHQIRKIAPLALYEIKSG